MIPANAVDSSASAERRVLTKYYVLDLLMVEAEITGLVA